MANVKELAKIFQTLDGLLYVDPEDLDSDIVKETFEKALQEHDFFYAMSDDGFVYNRGRLEDAILIETVARHKHQLEPIYLEYVKMKEGRI